MEWGLLKQPTCNSYDVGKSAWCRPPPIPEPMHMQATYQFHPHLNLCTCRPRTNSTRTWAKSRHGCMSMSPAFPPARVAGLWRTFGRALALTHHPASPCTHAGKLGFLSAGRMGLLCAGSLSRVCAGRMWWACVQVIHKERVQE